MSWNCFLFNGGFGVLPVRLFSLMQVDILTKCVDMFVSLCLYRSSFSFGQCFRNHLLTFLIQRAKMWKLKIRCTSKVWCPSSWASLGR